MKIFKLMVVALVAMCGFASCSEDCDHNFIEVDYSNDIVGTWTCQEANYAAAFVFKADGTAFTTGVENGEYWENVQVNWKVVNNKLTLNYGDNTSETLLEIISGEYLSISDKNGDRRKTYKYCANDLADEVVGMWVCTEGVFGNEEESSIIVTYKDNGKAYFSGFFPETNGYVNQIESNYKVIGNMIFSSVEDGTRYLIKEIDIIPNGTELGDIMTTYDLTTGTNPSFLRIKQSLNLTGTYDYSSAYISNVKGKDEDFTILGHTFNMADIKGGNFDMLFRSELFCVDLNTNTITQHFLPANGQDVAIKIPTTVEGNKVTLDYSAVTSGLRKVDMYMFQDADDSQLHMYMHTDAFINYFANLEVATMLQAGEINSTDAAAVEKVYTDMKSRIESINVSFVFKARK